MNRNSWESAERSSAFGIELNNQFYNQLRAATRAALDAEGLTLENLATASDIAQADAAEQERLKEDRERNAQNEKISNSLFLTAAVGLLPKLHMVEFYGQLENTVEFKTTDRQEAYDILDSITWFNNIPYWMIGYRYTDHSALFMPATPTLDYYTKQFDRLFTSASYRPAEYSKLSVPFKNELRFSTDDDSYLWALDRKKGKPGLRLSEVPASMRFAAKVNQAYTFHPGRKDRKRFAKFAETEARLETRHLVDDVYDHEDRAFVIGSKAPKVFSRQDRNSRFAGSEDSYDSNMVPTDLMNHYNVFDGLVRLMARFNKGPEYLNVMQRAKEGDIERVVLEQQGIPVLPSREAIIDYFKNKYSDRYDVRSPAQVTADEDSFWEQWLKDRGNKKG